ncbi:MAG: small ribosomal subunit biogenesis GTPase RsgA [Merismopedia sp. SIO2A8]|nr:small ribosomal subunit biogenesis GTPase RsgA [Merismopedia sp. SIO2A8]
MLGTVLSVQANYYWVRLDAIPVEVKTGGLMDDALLLCTRRSRLKKMGQQIWVGDRVQVEEPDWEGQRGAISNVLPRTTELDRPPVANASHILLMFAMADPVLDPAQLSRFLVKAESTNLAVSLCLNKSDLVSEEAKGEWSDRLSQWGYQPMIISLSQQKGLDQLVQQLQPHNTIVSGPSGVGKSSLINQLIPTVEQRVNAVSGKLGRGRHTTRHVELFALPTGGLVADTPGFNQPELDCFPRQLGQYFPEIRQRLSQQRCQFNDCFHRDEPNCIVRGDWERYEHYLVFLEEAIARHEQQGQRSDKETATKVMSGQSGRDRVEPKLETKRYRRKSRRRETQELKDFRGDVRDMLTQEALTQETLAREQHD